MTYHIPSFPETPLGADFRWIGDHGIGRFATEVLRRLECRDVRAWTPLLHPMDPLVQGLAVRRLGCKVYFSPGFNPPIASGVPSIFTIHDLMHMRLRAEGSLSKTLFYKCIVRPAARRSPAVLTVSEYSKQQIVEWAGLPEANVHVVGNGVSECFSSQGDAANLDFPYLLYVGNYKPHKNLPRLIDAFARSSAIKDFTLCLVGKEDPELTKRAKARKLDRKIKFLGFKTNEELAALYRGAHSVLCPSLEEGFALPVLEGMACGTPSVIGVGHAAEEVAGGAALKCDPLDVESITEAIDIITTKSDVRSELRSRGLERAKEFTWDQVARRVALTIAKAYPACRTSVWKPAHNSRTTLEV